jgi:hypothetical protein
MVQTRTIGNELKALCIVAVMVLIGQAIGYKISILEAIPGIILVILISQLSLVIKAALPKVKFPAFAWASLIALLLSMPFMPTAKIFLQYTNKVSFLATTTPILAFAGIAVGNKVLQLEKLSWKVLIISMFVFLGTFFGSAIIAQIILKLQGII